MKNVHEILKVFDIAIPEDKKKDFDKAIFKNHKTVAEVEGIKGKLTKAETELSTANSTITKITGDLINPRDSSATTEGWKGKFEPPDLQVKKDAEAATKSGMALSHIYHPQKTQ